MWCPVLPNAGASQAFINHVAKFCPLLVMTKPDASAMTHLALEGSMKAAVSLAELKQIALTKIREHRGCHDVEDVSVCPLEDSDPNWAISCGVGGSDKTAASKAALYVEQEMSRSYELLIDD
jgi:hypothetical protein